MPRVTPVLQSRCRGDAGTALVEAAFFTPVFLYIVFGFAELGLFLRTYITMSAALGDGARQGAIVGNTADVDYQMLQVIKRDLAAVPTSHIKVVVVFNAGTANAANPPAATAPAACRQAGLATPVSLTDTGAKCNAYTPATDWAATDARLYGCTTVAPISNRSAGWCPDGRLTAATSIAGDGPPDYLGIYIRVDHGYLTGLFGRTKTVEQTIITRLEPQSLS
jgi:Flp pilus assembly protein TadG